MTWRQSKEVALGAALLTVLLLPYMHVAYYIRPSFG